ncbi:Rhodanese-like domain containing protein [Tritrichomonas foetus]|uniref:protein-tyrosine-phosphatase n=1 Tax=Tritrichomonas foetus TaxID=1144522 RepID=A0A1J4L1L1_9EUKA|nr:Rhodanese-like domain containing protein [Tritrichomonas foetus]|eukprot:OHT17323.1 Rhodanese-like domain containing protein [Tritrichomonas foetus]
MLDQAIPLPDLFDDEDQELTSFQPMDTLRMSASFLIPQVMSPPRQSICDSDKRTSSQSMPMRTRSLSCQFSSSCSQQSTIFDFNDKNSDPFKTISSHELALLLKDPSSHQFDQIIILDARFEYEYRGGKIRGARNINSRAVMIGVFNHFINQNVLIVFHCEFSQNRGPTLMRMFRDYDRKQNYQNYPALYFPHICLLEGGYSKFFYDYPELCIGGYTPMRDAEFIDNGLLKKCHSDYSKNMLQDGKTTHLQRRKSLTAPRVNFFGFQLSKSCESEFGITFSASQPTL